MNDVEKLRMLAEDLKEKKRRTTQAIEVQDAASQIAAKCRQEEWRAQEAFHDFVRALTNEKLADFGSGMPPPTSRPPDLPADAELK